MMNPEMMRMAMEQMSRMTPQQMADMQRQMANLPPGFVQQQMAAMNSMDPALLQQRMRDANLHTPSGQSQTPSGQPSHSPQERLKEEGNKFFGAGKYLEAAAKYEEVKSELAGASDPEAATLRQKCMLNLASCYLKLAEHDKCVQQCSEVLRHSPGDRKALYRRGQSYSALNQYPAAVADLQEALQRSPAEEKPIIKEKLDHAKEGLQAVSKPDVAAQDDSSGSPAPEIPSTVVIEEETEREAKQSDKQAAPQPSGSNAPSQIPAGFTRPMPNVSQEDMQQTLRMMRENPSMMKHMRNTLASMTPEQMQAATRMAGMPEMPGFDPQAMRQAADMMASMSPEALEQMTSMAAARQAVAEVGQQAPPPIPEMQHSGTQEALQAMQLASMQANPDMMRQAADMMSNMDPEQMSSMMASMQSGSGGPDPLAMAGLLRDPKSREMMQKMMSNIDAQQLAAMSKAAGQKLTPEQAEMMSAQMRNMSDAQMEKLLATMSWIQSASTMLQKAQRKAADNKLLCIALAILIVAIVLRWLGLV